jgi:hypothetical protein
MLDQVRSEFGVEVEIVDANLTGAWAPEGPRAPSVLAGPELRRIGMGVLREGRATVARVEGREYRLVPLRNAGSVSPTALMAMRVTTERPAERAVQEIRAEHAQDDPWVEVLRGAIEADLSNREELDGERQQARAVRGALRFVTYLASARTEREVAEAAIQAAAVWFDADARVYRQLPSTSQIAGEAAEDRGGEYVLVASLPGAQVAPEEHRLSQLSFGFDAPFVRVAPVAGVAGGREGVVVPMAPVTTGSVEWALVLLGTVPPEAEVTLEALGRVLGLQMERLALARAAQVRATFEQVLVRADRPVELIALDLLRELVVRASGESASLWVQQGDDIRRIAAVGAGVVQSDIPPTDAAASTSDADRFTTLQRSFPLGSNSHARLELRAEVPSGREASFASESLVAMDACVSVLRAWLPAAVRIAPHAPPLLSSSMVADFARRIDEELARAKRFDRNLALVVVESGVLPWPQETIDRLVGVLRGELRGSDVLGLVGERRVVALLIETHQSALGTVVRRLRDRLGRAIPELKLPALVLGQAALSRECATAEALLSQAVINAEIIPVPA